jgi:hypothetical protein
MMVLMFLRLLIYIQLRQVGEKIIDMRDYDQGLNKEYGDPHVHNKAEVKTALHKKNVCIPKITAGIL